MILAIIMQMADLLTFLFAVSIYGMAGEYGLGAAVAGGVGTTFLMKTVGVGILVWASNTGLGRVWWRPFGRNVANFKIIIVTLAVVLGTAGTITNVASIGLAL